MGIRYTEHGKELGAQSKSLHGHIEIRYKKSNDGWEVYSNSEGKVLFTHKFRDDCEDYKASMYGLFRLVATVPWRIDNDE